MLSSKESGPYELRFDGYREAVHDLGRKLEAFDPAVLARFVEALSADSSVLSEKKQAS